VSLRRGAYLPDRILALLATCSALTIILLLVCAGERPGLRGASRFSYVRPFISRPLAMETQRIKNGSSETRTERLSRMRTASRLTQTLPPAFWSVAG